MHIYLYSFVCIRDFQSLNCNFLTFIDFLSQFLLNSFLIRGYLFQLAAYVVGDRIRFNQS